MKFRILPDEPWKLEITAENLEDIKELIKHCSLPVETLIGHEPDRELVHIWKLGQHRGQRWFETEAQLSADWVKPYFSFLTKITGFTGEMPMTDAPLYDSTFRYISVAGPRLAARIGTEGFWAKGIVAERMLHDDNRSPRDGVHQAEKYFTRLVQEDIGYHPTVSEYVEVGNGLYERNPAWGQWRPPKIVDDPKRLGQNYWRFVFDWWLENKATPAQHEYIYAVERNYQTVCRRTPIADYFTITVYIDRLPYDWGNKPQNLTLEQFHQLGVTKSFEELVEENMEDVEKP